MKIIVFHSGGVLEGEMWTGVLVCREVGKRKKGEVFKLVKVGMFY